MSGPAAVAESPDFAQVVLAPETGAAVVVMVVEVAVAAAAIAAVDVVVLPSVE